MKLSDILVALVVIPLVTGCTSIFNPRPPVIEDKVGYIGNMKIGTLATSPDYRVVYVKLDDDAQICAEAPADAGAQFGSAFAAALDADSGSTPQLNAEARINMAVAMKQLFKRSQGVQLYRDGAFTLCNLYLNKAISTREYLTELKELRKTAKELIEKEIPFLEKIQIDPISMTTVSAPTLRTKK